MLNNLGIGLHTNPTGPPPPTPHTQQLLSSLRKEGLRNFVQSDK